MNFAMSAHKLANKDDMMSQLLLIVFSIGASVSIYLNWLANNPDSRPVASAALPFLIFFLVLSLALLRTQSILRSMVFRSPLSDSSKRLYLRYDSLTYAVFMAPALGGTGIQFVPTAVIFMIGAFVCVQGILVYSLIDRRQKGEIFASLGWLSFLFLISGFAAIIYQIVWQRSLFTAFGVNIESITVIVTIFMFGLGVGSILGGKLSRRFPLYLPHLFLLIEVAIGAFGIISLPLIKAMGHAQIHGSLLQISLATFGLLSVPTILMGSTLPILVTYLHRYYKNIGKSVGLLYFINTIGSAIACFITADILFAFFGKQTAVIVAAYCNFTVGVLVYRYTKRIRDRLSEGPSQEFPEKFSIRGAGEEGLSFRFVFILILSCITGYISLSQEIIWFRAVSYATGGDPNVFAYVLGIVLTGIASGSLLSKKVCEAKSDYSLIFIAAMLSLSSISYFVALPVASHLITISKPLGMLSVYIAVGVCSFLIGGIFPLLCHFGITSGKTVGVSLSLVYFANILGATAGPLLTGFILFNVYSLEQNILFISVFTVILSGIVWLFSPLSRAAKAVIAGGTLLVAAGIFFVEPNLYLRLLERLHFKHKDMRYDFVIQNRSGIIAGGNTIYGGGVYDGTFNTDPVLDTNGITRVYMIAALHPGPEEVLEIGLSGGAWASVIADYAGVKKLTAVEINPGYLELIREHPEVSSILHDRKITIYIDDGRRWLNRNPEALFDLIVMNTTFHWRDGATNLLSDEFLRLCKKHLKAGGVVYFNTTFSNDAVFTAAQVFKHVVMVKAFVAAGDSPFTLSEAERRRNLMKFEFNGRPVFSADDEAVKRVREGLVTGDITEIADKIRKQKGMYHITDDNMATEFKLKKRWFDPDKSWAKLLKRPRLQSRL